MTSCFLLLANSFDFGCSNCSDALAAVMQISQAVRLVHLFSWKGREEKQPGLAPWRELCKARLRILGGSCGVFCAFVDDTLLSVIS